MSLISVRCYTCGNILANKYETYLRETIDLPQIEYAEAGSLSQPSRRALVMDKLGLDRECCRANVLTHVYNSKFPVGASKRSKD